MVLIKMVTMMTTTMENRCPIIEKAALTIERQPQLSTEIVILSKTAKMRKNQLRRHTKNMKLQQGPITNQINILSLGPILETLIEEQEIMKLLLICSIKGNNFILNYAKIFFVYVSTHSIHFYLVINSQTSLHPADTKSILKGRTTAAVLFLRIEEVEEPQEVEAEETKKHMAAGDSNNTLTIINNSILTTTTITTTELFSQLKTSISDSLFIISCLHSC